MEKSNLIACLYPAEPEYRNKSTWDAVRLNQGNGKIEQEQDSLESLLAIEEICDPRTDEGIPLTFNPGPRAGQGLFLGSDVDKCDVHLPKLRGISGRHCYLTFDAKRRLILRDCSRFGTSVEYGDQGGETRATIRLAKPDHFTWILSGEGFLDGERILIKIGDIKFKIVVSEQSIDSPRYIENVDRFLRQAHENEEFSFSSLSIQNTPDPSRPQTPQPRKHNPIYIDEKLIIGSGSYSTVRRVWDVSTGIKYAAKHFKDTGMIVSNWKEEASNLERVSRHEHIVNFIGLMELPKPHMILEYLPLGNLADVNANQHITYEETVTILCQCLDALTFMHESGIVHRDIKPENILVKSRYPLHIKLSDFGLSKKTSDLKTICRTIPYMAPEILEVYNKDTPYTNACDIWSLGVVASEYAYGPLPDEYRVHKIIEKLKGYRHEPLASFLLSAMIVVEPGGRDSARDCLEKASKLGALPQNRCQTPTQASYSTSDCLKKTSRLHASTASTTPTEVATFITTKPLRNQGSIVQETNTRTSQATVDRSSIGYDSEEQDPEGQQNLANSSIEGRTQGKKRSKIASPSLSERSSRSLSDTLHSPTVVRRSKRVRQTQRNMVDPTDLFGAGRIQDPNCVGSSVAALRDDLDEEA